MTLIQNTSIIIASSAYMNHQKIQNAHKEFFNPGVTVDIVIFTIDHNQLKILLTRRSIEPFRGVYALPGGFVHEGETTRDAALRVLKDKGGIRNVYVEQLYTFDALGRDPRGQILSVTYFALVPRDNVIIQNTLRTESPEFIPITDLPQLAFDHRDIINYAHKRLADKVKYTNIIHSLIPKYFTLTELQKTFEAILGSRIDKRNFRKKIIGLGLITATKKMRRGTRQRPALLYRFKSTSFKEIEKFLGK
jgi:8-oxo-dGTP diphosphatase